MPLNDSLTSFRIVAVANAEAGLFGTGQTSIRSTQDLMLFSGLPPLVREQDAYRAGFTVRNASEGAARRRSCRRRSTRRRRQAQGADDLKPHHAQPCSRARRRMWAGT